MLLFISNIILFFSGAAAGSSGGSWEAFKHFYNEWFNIPGFEAWKFLNLFIFAAIGVYLLKKPLGDAFKAKREAIRAELIKAAKTALPCWNVDTQAIWERFLAFNRARGNARDPAGYLLGFMRRWRTGSSSTASSPLAAPVPQHPADPKAQELHDQIRAAPSANRQFHASDLCRLIGQAAYDARVVDVVRKFGCPKFAAILAVHGRAVLAGEIPR